MRTIHVLRKPCSEGTVAANVLRHGTGAINVDACRIGTATDVPSIHTTRKSDYPQSYTGNGAVWGRSRGGYAGDEVHWEPRGGRWPANLIIQHLAGCQLNEETVAAWTCAPGCPVAGLDQQSGVLSPQGSPKRVDTRDSSFLGTGFGGDVTTFYGDTGGASRFFKQVKP